MDRKKIFHLLMVLAVFVTAIATSTSVQAAVPQNCTKIHTVQKGEYLSQIAKLYGVSWKWLADINDLVNPSKIFPGQKICVALGDGSTGGVCTKYHTVKRGEYLVQIARLYGVSWRWLADINNLANPSRIYPGQVLCVQTGNSSGGPPANCTQYYTVVKGDYLSKIAKRFNVSWRWLADINNLVNPNRIYPGQVLCVATG
jgi:lysozyme